MSLTDRLVRQLDEKEMLLNQEGLERERVKQRMKTRMQQEKERLASDMKNKIKVNREMLKVRETAETAHSEKQLGAVIGGQLSGPASSLDPNQWPVACENIYHATENP